ncbi:MAG TPA: M56 family metallopeptidase [Terriglobia bacterium]|nr:M56 family metallopeptidase [Terriglobia bacterium]
MTAIAHAISAALLHFLWQGPLVAFVLWVTLTTLRSGSARLRHFVSCAALAIMVALPEITAWLVYRGQGAAGSPTSRVVGIPDSPGPAIWPAGASPSTWIAAPEAWALPLWCAGVLIFGVRLIWSSRHVARLRREGDAAEAPLVQTVLRLARRMSIRRPVRVLISGLADSPSVAGWLRPVLLLPAASLLNLNVEQLEAVLAHELAHIRRHDYLVNVLQTLAETLFFYQPAVWWVSSCIRNERELCCDDLAVEICGDPVGYARALTKLERLRVISPGLALSSTAGPLLRRIQRLTGAVEEQPPSRLPAVLALSLALACGLMTSLHWANAQPQAAGDTEVARDAVWFDTVKFGDLPIMVRALGSMTTPSTAELKVAAPQANLVQIGQSTSVDLRQGTTIAGKVTHIDPNAVNGTVTVEVEVQAPVPEFTAQPVDGIIRIRTLHDVVFVGRPVFAKPDSQVTVFEVESDGSHAKRVKVRFGAISYNAAQILEGLQPGERVILSDMSKYDGYDRVHLK